MEYDNDLIQHIRSVCVHYAVLGFLFSLHFFVHIVHWLCDVASFPTQFLICHFLFQTDLLRSFVFSISLDVVHVDGFLVLKVLKRQ
jgi:hypothetical protein